MNKYSISYNDIVSINKIKDVYDALILWYLFEYKYINNCTSFGLNSYDKVLDKLRHIDLAFLVCSKDNIIEKVNGDFDNYNHYKALSNNSYSKNLNREELISF